ncbi:MAG: hypothetical protein QOF57_2507 [Frankiaceae bacterium]|jgi:hypothetical protein|nr:hypothetical protein [Frankiaceae bacterium]
MTYCAQLWRGKDAHGKDLPIGHPWRGLRQRVYTEARALAVAQAQAMDLLDPRQEFQFANPDPRQYVGVDGTVFSVGRYTKRALTSCQEHIVGGKVKVFGAKFTIASIRIPGQFKSRVILSYDHTGTRDPASAHPDESAAVEAVIPVLAALSNGGVKGVVVDSIVRGKAVIRLQRNGMTVVNHPHAAANPDTKPGHRHNSTRVEKSHFAHRRAT